MEVFYLRLFEDLRVLRFFEDLRRFLPPKALLIALLYSDESFLRNISAFFILLRIDFTRGEF